MTWVENITNYRLNDFDLEPGEKKQVDWTERVNHLIVNKVLKDLGDYTPEPETKAKKIKPETEVKKETEISSDKEDSNVDFPFVRKKYKKYSNKK